MCSDGLTVFIPALRRVIGPTAGSDTLTPAANLQSLINLTGMKSLGKTATGDWRI